MANRDDLCLYCGAEIFPGKPCGTCKDSKEHLYGAWALLDTLMLRFPPPAGKNHAILPRVDGEDGLMVLIHAGDSGMTLNLDLEDLGKPVLTLLSELTELIKTEMK